MENFAGLRKFCRQQLLNETRIHRKPPSLLFKIMFLALICRRFLGGFIHALLSRAYMYLSVR